jgi:hypothetical protein
MLLWVLLFVMLAFTGWRHLQQRGEMHELQTEIERIDAQVAAITPLALASEGVVVHIQHIHQRLALIDSLRAPTIPISSLLRHLAEQTEALNAVWLTEFAASDHTFSVSGNSLYRSRVYQVANTLRESRINSVGIMQVQNKDIYNYDITATVPARAE